MARIRTIKPAFFRHGGLFDAEKSTGLPLRVAFAGLWTAADREGRFKWRPRELKLDCLPFDDVDFSRVLDALVTGGWLVHYEYDGVQYGAILSWKEHQVINNREAASDLPPPSENNGLTREARVADASPTPLNFASVEGKGREGKGKELSSASRPSNDCFEKLKQAYPKRNGNYGWKAAERKFSALVKTGVDPEIIIAAARKLCHTLKAKIGTEYIPMPASWLNSEDFTEIAAKSFVDQPEDLNWEAVLSSYKKTGHWSRFAGNDPTSPNCRAPPELLEKHGIRRVPENVVD